MICRLCFTSDGDNHFQRLYVECKCKFICYDLNYYRYSCYHDKFNDIISYELVIGRIYNYGTQTCKITILPLDMQNYHFAPRGNFLGLISKITTSSYLSEFYDYIIYFII